MKPTDFQLVIDDIEKNMEGEGYEIAVSLRSGEQFCGAWQALGTPPRIAVLSMPDAPPIYIDVEEIAVVTLV